MGNKLTNWLLKNWLRLPQDYMVHLGKEVQEGSLFVAVHSRPLWEAEPARVKRLSLLTRIWTPSPELLRQKAQTIFTNFIFGGEEDYGDQLLTLAAWHHNRKWSLDALTPEDKNRAKSIASFTLLTRTRFSKLPYVILPLELGKEVPDICFLAFPMVVKIPVITVRHFVDLHYAFAFNSIRRSGHPQADPLVAYLYEIGIIQQKIAIALHEYVRLIHYARDHKQGLLINAEVDAIREIENTVTQLKASMEKIVVLVGLIHGVTKLDEKKNHGAKLEALRKGLPKPVLETPYWKIIEDFISPASLEALNNYRTGMLHKKGIGKLQPHQYVDKEFNETPFLEVFAFLHEQHGKNSTVLLCALALLTDRLVELDPPDETEKMALMELMGSTK